MLLTAAGCNYFMGVPCADDVMLSYQSTSFHDGAAMRKLFGLTPAPEFLAWLETRGIFEHGQLALTNASEHPLVADVQAVLNQPLATD
jgi:ethanolamine ammonia-lyase large subunit